MPSVTRHDSTDVGLTTPILREELEQVAPDLLDKFDHFNREKDDRIEQYMRQYYEPKRDLAQTQATTRPDESRNPDVEPTSPESHSTDESASSLGIGSPTTNTDTSNSSRGFGQPQAAVRTTHRAPLSDSTRSNGTSGGFSQPQVAVRVQNRVPNSDTTRSNGTFAGFSGVQAGVRIQNRVSLPESSRSRGTFSEKPSTGQRDFIPASEALLTMRVQIRLLPVVQLLTASDLTPSLRNQARELAQAALHYAMDCNASFPLAARCSFYIAHTYYDPDNKATLQDAVTWFQRAIEASEGGYPEGQWAQEWLNRYQSVNLAADSRPSTASSWFSGKVNGVWNMIMGSRASSASSAAQSRPNFLWRLYSNESKRAAPHKAAAGNGIPSFSTENDSSISPVSATSSATQDHYGLKWSQRAPFGKGEILPGTRFEMVQSPEPINEEDEDDEEQHIPANILGGFVDSGSLSPAMQRSPAPLRPRRPRKRSAFYIPDYVQEKQWRIVNQTSEPSSPESPGVGTDAATQPDDKKPSPTTSSYFTSAPTTTKQHSRAQSFAAYPSPPLPHSPQSYADSERASSPTPTSNSSGTAARHKKRGSLSLIIRATGLDVHRAKRDEAAQMEEGESPAFTPRKEEEGLYRRRSNDVVEEEV